MASVCISSCVDDVRAPVRATYTNLYKWPESDFEFVRSMSSRAREPARSEPHAPRVYGHPRVVDSISCRQLYLRSYTFSREEDHRPQPALCRRAAGSRCRDGLRRARATSCSALAAVFRRLLSCTTEVDVVN